MKAEPFNWPRESICLQPSSLDSNALAGEIYPRTCRVDFDAPGFCLLNVGRGIESRAFRRLMVDLKQAMSAIHESVTGMSLGYLSAARFDQQETTRPHLDGGPSECFLMLGYEPSPIDSELEVSDYARCAFDHGLTPMAFMAEYNPMFEDGRDLLRPYTTRLSCFSNSDYQIVVVNNSCARYSETRPAWQGVVHSARIPNPDESAHRVIDSTMIAPVSAGRPDVIDGDALDEFIAGSVVQRGGYRERDLEDDT